MSTPSRGPSLVVPIDLAALCVGQNDQGGTTEQPYGTGNFARIAADFSILPYLNDDGASVNTRAYVSEQVVPQPFAEVPSGLEPGVHLHWALPDALAHG